MKVLILEEKTTDINKLKELLYSSDRTLQIEGTTTTATSIVDFLKNNPIPDILLINKNLASELNIDKIEEQKIKAVITFSSENGDYNFETYKYFNDDQSLINNPLFNVHSGQELSNGFSPVKIRPNPRFTSHKLSDVKEYKERFLVKQGQRLASIPTDQIAYFLSEDRFIFFKTFDNVKYLTEYRIEELENMVDPRRFFRINRSFLVSINAIQQIHQYFGNRLKLFLEPSVEKDIIVSRERVTDFKIWLGE